MGRVFDERSTGVNFGDGLTSVPLLLVLVVVVFWWWWRLARIKGVIIGGGSVLCRWEIE